MASGHDSPDPTDDDRMALACYARAMDHVGAMSDDPVFRWVDRVILDLHFDACHFQKDKDPGSTADAESKSRARRAARRRTSARTMKTSRH